MTADSAMLHRISVIVWEDEELISGMGRAVCGLEGYFSMPGIFARMGLSRCLQCCDALRIPHGDGAPFNQARAPWADE